MTAKTDKVVDVYQDRKVVDGMVERYGKGTSDETRAEIVAELAGEFGKSVQSIRAKLTREGVYIAKTRKTKSGGEVVSKSTMVDRIDAALGIKFTDGEALSLEKATKSTLRKILEKVQVEAEVEVTAADAEAEAIEVEVAEAAE